MKVYTLWGYCWSGGCLAAACVAVLVDSLLSCSWTLCWGHGQLLASHDVIMELTKF